MALSRNGAIRCWRHRYASGIRALIEAGISIELDHRYKFLIPEMQALKAKGEFPDAAFDENLRRYLCVLMLCGMFDDPSMFTAQVLIPRPTLRSPGNWRKRDSAAKK